MAYAVTNPPALLVDRVSGSGAIWSYRSADVIGDVDATGYFTNGEDLGMKVGDLVSITVTGSGATYLFRVSAIASGAATVAALSTP